MVQANADAALTGKVVSLATDPVNLGVVYASSNEGIFRSADAGVSWTAINSAISSSIACLAVDPAAPNTIYAGTSGGFFRSPDGGGTWAEMARNTPFVNVAIDPSN